MKKIFIVVILILETLVLSSCESGVSRITITTYPDKLVYVAGIDEEIDLRGGQLAFYYEDKSGPYFAQMEEAVDPETAGCRCSVKDNVNFNKAGVYSATLYVSDKIYVEFPIQVVSREWLQEQLDKASGH